MASANKSFLHRRIRSLVAKSIFGEVKSRRHIQPAKWQKPPGPMVLKPLRRQE
ncbi:hypothetical protein [Paenibacillus macquariensis]|uniref:hypothetical protein n=1 Tax=Paenibacillus macquariensis TaxID=948756 RepID=UPI001471F7A2|nr:hypothetical protein [Paenibacillus macquariensis]MEC0094187.1 hypothetical protein [Paenibacillus macquariensis]